MSQSTFYRHLPDNISGGSNTAAAARPHARPAWPPLRPGEQNVLIVSIINVTTMPAFRVRAAVVRACDQEEVHDWLLGTAVAQCPMPFAELAELGRRQNLWLDHALLVRFLSWSNWQPVSRWVECLRSSRSSAGGRTCSSTTRCWYALFRCACVFCYHILSSADR